MVGEEPVGARQGGRAWRRELFGSINLALTFLLTIPFFVVPIAGIVLYSFASQDYVTAKIRFGWTLGAWRALNDPVLVQSFVRSVELATFAMIGCALIGYPLAYFVARHAGRFTTAALILIIVPFWISFIVRAYAWLDILAENGPINRALMGIGIISSPLQLSNNSIGIAIGLIYGYLPLMVFPIYVALERIDSSLLESARDLGCSAFTAFRRVTFPQALPGLVAGCILVWVPALGEYVIPTVMGGGKTFMVGNVIALKFNQFNWPVGAAMSVALMLIALLVVAVVLRLLGRERLGAFDQMGA